MTLKVKLITHFLAVTMDLLGIYFTGPFLHNAFALNVTILLLTAIPYLLRTSHIAGASHFPSCTSILPPSAYP